jgi:uncharacterized protein YdiU (UPF0061 family)
MKLTNTYEAVAQGLSLPSQPSPVSGPRLLLWNEGLARSLGLGDALRRSRSDLAQIFAGNRVFESSRPAALAYAGHQFGQFVPQLGDGRAHLLGELTDPSGARWDLQLKGSGVSAFSRGGDGRCALGPAVREYLMSEAMQALRVPTTRCLAVVTTGERVNRQEPLPGAVVTRVASSHVRVGTFEYFAARKQTDAVRRLCDYVVERHYPQIVETGAQRAIALLEHVIARQIELIVHWLRVGFIHGVMNTDNTALSGETIDYGPCAMMSAYDPRTVFSSIDHYGRYAFGNQPAIMQWNMARLAECLLPLIDSDEKRAVERIVGIIEAISQQFDQAFLEMMRGKLGLSRKEPDDAKLVAELLDSLQEQTADYTITFRSLARSLGCAQTRRDLAANLGTWFDRWQARLGEELRPAAEIQAAMNRQNPAVIPRNHHVEAALSATLQTGDASAVERMLDVLRSPYEEQARTHEYQDAPPDNDRHYRTFCGT